jgi:hypothetical protein
MTILEHNSPLIDVHRGDAKLRQVSHGWICRKNRTRLRESLAIKPIDAEPIAPG